MPRMTPAAGPNSSEMRKLCTVVTVPANARDLALDPSGRRLAIAGGNGSALVYAIDAPKK